MRTIPLDAQKSSSLYGKPSFTFLNRVQRALWSVAWFVLAAWTPPPFHAWRRFVLRLFGARIASTARIYASTRVWFPPNLWMQAHSVLGPRVNCYCQDQITLQEFSTVSQGAHLCAGTHDVDDPTFQLVTKPIVIGARAWVAAEAFVGPGVTLFEGAVLGARGVTFRNLEAWTVYAGNPATKIRLRSTRTKNDERN